MSTTDEAEPLAEPHERSVSHTMSYRVPLRCVLEAYVPRPTLEGTKDADWSVYSSGEHDEWLVFAISKTTEQVYRDNEWRDKLEAERFTLRGCATKNEVADLAARVEMMVSTIGADKAE